jgi:co-chaperonin GroES (HSP10)
MSKQISIGDKVTFKHGFGTVVDKRETAYAYEYDILAIRL